MKFKISLLILVTSLIGIWFTVDMIELKLENFYFERDVKTWEESQEEFLYLMLLLGFFLLLDTAGIILSIYYGIKFANEKYNEWMDRKEGKKSPV